MTGLATEAARPRAPSTRDEAPFRGFATWMGGVATWMGGVAAWMRDLAAQVAAGLSRQAINRRVLRQLGGMSDRELRDIGLIRQDVADAAALAPDRDSTDLLLARRNERRGARGRRSA